LERLSNGASTCSWDVFCESIMTCAMTNRGNKKGKQF
jgi:hypothetical protein